MSGTSPPEGEMTRLLRAVRFAAERHRDHRRKGLVAAPYINHPIAVAEQLAGAGLEGDTELLMAAVLHDVLEDTETAPEELEEMFGKRVARIVMEVTDDPSLETRERKRETVSTIAAKSREAQLVKLSDLIANAHDVIHYPPDWSDKRKIGYFDWCEEIVRRIEGLHPPLERRFAQLVAEGRGRLAG